MSAVFLRSELYTVTGNAAGDGPASRLLLDEPGLTFRSTSNVATLNIDAGKTIIADTLALVGAKLNTSDTIRVQAGSTTAYADLDYSHNAWNGAGRDDGAICYIAFPQLVGARYFKVTITTSKSIVEVSRLLVGERIEVDGIDEGPELTYQSGSGVSDGLGWTTVEEQRSRIAWKANVGNVRTTDFLNRWAPFLNKVGRHAGFLFIPNTDSIGLQHEAALVRNQQDAKVSSVTSDRRRVELQLLEV